MFPTFPPLVGAYPVLMENFPVIGANIGTCAHRMPLTAPSRREESTLLRWGVLYKKVILSKDIFIPDVKKWTYSSDCSDQGARRRYAEYVCVSMLIFTVCLWIVIFDTLQQIICIQYRHGDSSSSNFVPVCQFVAPAKSNIAPLKSSPQCH